ncbi:hypothetical protein S40285_01911 [Stachybotrys chlorohalonatus IBT 40285]|uniref:Vezatin n=1 Tax=Stachybotrys chlorohalonatus (strain IBT 40285) TaxID=1283841 RepID=A0A084QQR9_STAC4|nr:hypothetical protein S40285_01911 [Stachybotrys chlorohalonata IBT 40285]
MEPVVFEETPLADYLKDGGDDSEPEWASAGRASTRDSSIQDDISPQLSPIPTFAPTGRPLVKARFRSHVPKALQLGGSGPAPLRSFRRSCSVWLAFGKVLGLVCTDISLFQAAVAASIDGGDNKFLERFRYIIVASQLLSAHSMPGQSHPNLDDDASTSMSQGEITLTAAGLVTSVVGALSVAGISSLAVGRAPSYLTWTRMLVLLLLLGGSVIIGRIFVRRQWLQYRRQQSMSELKTFIAGSHDFDRASSAALSLIQEVELVSRGYRLSTPLPPISRLEDRSQLRRCVRLRKALKTSFTYLLGSYKETCNSVQGLSEQTDLEKYYDIYDITDFDISDTLRISDDTEFDDPESLRTLKIVAARFHTTRKMFLCALLAFDANGDDSDLQRWTAAVEALQKLNAATVHAYESLQTVLGEEEVFPVPTASKTPLTPGRERWRSSLRKINSLTSGIRGLQAKLQLLREESDRALNNSDDISELGPTLMSQYESIGQDLKDLMSSWEEGRAALAHGIEKNEKRLSSASTLFSPSISLNGLSVVDEGGNADDAFRALTGESPPPSVSNGEAGEAPSPEVFEAVARPRPRSTLTREERIIKVREDRETKALARQQMDATKGMLRELETVINLRPRARTSVPLPLPTRVASL